MFSASYYTKSKYVMTGVGEPNFEYFQLMNLGGK